MGSKRSRQNRQGAASGGGINRTYVIIGAIAVVLLGGFIALVVFDARQQAASSPPGEVQTYDVGPGGEHSQEDVDYDQTPPTGGVHNPVWQNAGFYDEPVRDETAVHTLEHGAIWIAYDPDLPADQKAQIRNLVEGQTCMLASPYPDLSAADRRLGLGQAVDAGERRRPQPRALHPGLPPGTADPRARRRLYGRYQRHGLDGPDYPAKHRRSRRDEAVPGWRSLDPDPGHRRRRPGDPGCCGSFSPAGPPATTRSRPDSPGTCPSTTPRPWRWPRSCATRPRARRSGSLAADWPSRSRPRSGRCRAGWPPGVSLPPAPNRRWPGWVTRPRDGCLAWRRPRR